MSTEEPKSPYTDRKLNDFVEIFQRQNFRIREAKESNIEPKHLTREEVASWVGCAPEELDQILEHIVKHRQSLTADINEHIAKAMYYDKKSFDEILAIYWFTAEQMEAFKKGSIYRLRKVKEDKAEMEAVNAIRDHLEVDARGEVGKPMMKIDHGDETFTVEIPKRLQNVAYLLEETEFDHDPDDVRRTSVAYRLRTDCAEIIKLASAACDKSATQFVEDLVLETAQLFVRAEAWSTSNDPETPVNHFIATKLYGVMAARYSGSSDGYFPMNQDDSMRGTSIINTGSHWTPVGGKQGPKVGFNNRKEAIDYFTRKLTDNAQTSARLSRSQERLAKRLTNCYQLDDKDFEEMKQEYVEDQSKRQGIVHREPKAAEENSDSCSLEDKNTQS